MEKPEQNLEFFKQLFTETLFIVPDQKTVPDPASQQPGNAASSVTADATAPVTMPEKNYVVSGQNQKGLVLIFRLPEPEFVRLQQNTFLLNILKAIGHGPADVGFVNLKPEVKIDLVALQQDLFIKSFIAFGMRFQPADKPYLPQMFEGIPYIISEAMANIENDKDKKGKLWLGLQQIFLNKN